MKYVFSLFFVLCFASVSSASLSITQTAYLNNMLKINPSSSLSISSNVKSVYSSNQFVQQGFYSGIISGSEYKILTPLETLTATASLPAPLRSVVGSQGSKIVAKRALGLMGPIAVAVTVGMTVKDIYDAVTAKPTSYPTLNNLTKVDPRAVAPAPNFSAGSIYSNNGKSYIITGANRVVASGGGYYSPASPIQYNTNSMVVFDMTGDRAYSYTVYPSYEIEPLYQPATYSQFETALYDPTTNALQPSLLTDVDNVMKAGLTSGQAVMSPTPQQIADLSKKVAADDATQKVVDTAQQNYNNNPTPENKLALDKALADKAALDQKNASDENLVPPDVPTNEYDSIITPPDKKNIPGLLQSFVSSSPLVAMVRSFNMTATGSGVVHVGTFYGQEINFDFSKYETTFAAMGGMLLVIAHGFAIFVVIRGW